MTVAIAALVIAACGDPNSAESGAVMEGHVVRVIQTGDRVPQGSGMRQPFQRLQVLLAIVPALRAGQDPLLATLAGAIGIVAVSVFVVHGFNRKSAAALVGTVVGLVSVAVVGALALTLAHVTGLATEDQIFVAVGTDGRIDMTRLALAGVIVGSLGALVDMSVGQASATMELASAQASLRGRALYASALNIGRDHIGSLVNTLGLAYFGGALPLVVLLSIGYQPLSVSLNSEEIVASLLTVTVASIGLVLCVPVTTAAAVAFAERG